MLIRAGKISDECSQTNIIRYSSDTQATSQATTKLFVIRKLIISSTANGSTIVFTHVLLCL